VADEQRLERERPSFAIDAIGLAMSSVNWTEFRPRHRAVEQRVTRDEDAAGLIEHRDVPDGVPGVATIRKPKTVSPS
jgi:hypothetical protein